VVISSVHLTSVPRAQGKTPNFRHSQEREMGQAYDTQICEMSLPAFKAAWVGLQSATNDDPLYLCTVDVFSEEVLRTVENLNLILRLFPEQQKQSVESVRDFLKKIETVCEVLPSSLPELEALKESFRGPVEAAAALSQWPMNQTSQPISPETLAEIDLHYTFFKEVVVSLQSDELIVNANVDCNSMFQERFEAHWNSMKDANANGLRKLNFERETNFPSSKLRKRPSFSIDFGNGHTIAIELKFFEKGHTANEINCSRGQIANYAMESEVISTWGLICVNASLREKTESRFVEFFSNNCLSEALLERIKLPFDYCLIDDDEDDDEEVEKEMGAEFTEAEPNGVHGIYDSMAVTTFEDLDLDGEWDLHIEDEVRPGTRDFQHFKNEPTGRAYLKKMLLFLREDPQSSGKPRVIFAGGPTQVGKTQFKNITIDAVHKVANDKRLSCLAATVVATDSVSGALGLIDKMAFHLDGTSVMKPQVFDQALTFDLMYPFKHFCLTSSGEEETRYEMLDLKNSDLLLKSRRRKNCLERGGCVVMSGRQTSQIQHVVDDIAALDDDRKIVLIIDEADYLLSKKHHLDPTAPAYLRHLTRLVLGEDPKVKPHIVVLITATPLALRANEYLSEQLSLDEKEVCPCFWADASDVSTSRYIGAETDHELAVIQVDNGARKILQSDITFSRPEKGGTLTLPPGQKAFFLAAFKDEHAMVLDASVRFIFANENCMFRKAALVQDKCAASAEHQIVVILYVGFGIFWSVEKGKWNGTRAEHGLPPHLKAHMLQLQVSYTHRKDVNPSIQEVLALPDINQCPVAIFGKTLMTRGISFRPKRGTHPASTQDRVPTHMLVSVGICLFLFSRHMRDVQVFVCLFVFSLSPAHFRSYN